ncbi:general substrate transporter [Lipomyces kononenkoae]
MCSASFLLFGYDNGVMSGLITSEQFFQVFPALEGNSKLQGTVTSLLAIGCCFGAIFTFLVGDNIGRRKCVMIGSVIVGIGVVIQTSSFSVAQMIVGRIVTGFGIGILTSTTPVYQSECSKAIHRGHDVAVELSTLILGIAIAYWIDYGFAYLSGSIAWRFPLGFQLVFIIILLLLSIYLPESPRWLLQHDLIEEGGEIIAVLRGLDIDDELVITERNEILTAIQMEVSNQRNWRRLFMNDEVQSRTRLIVSSLASIFQQICGTNALTYYSTVIYEQNVGLSRNMSLLMGGFLQIWFLIASIFTWYLIDRVGRRKLFVTAYLGEAVCMAVLGAMVHVGGRTAGIIAATATFVFQAFYTWGSMANYWVYPAELLSLQTRTKGAAFATATNWIFAFLVVQITPIGAASIGYKLYVMFAVICAFIAVFSYIFFPETANFSLESVDVLFADLEDKNIVSTLLVAVQRSKEARKLVKGHGEVDLQKKRQMEKLDVEHEEFIVENVIVSDEKTA